MSQMVRRNALDSHENRPSYDLSMAAGTWPLKNMEKLVELSFITEQMMTEATTKITLVVCKLALIIYYVFID